MTEAKPVLPQEGGSYTIDKKGQLVRQEGTVQIRDPEHPANKPHEETPPQAPLKDA
jgi:hypothetical protein